MECLGGNGYVEESLLPRLYREAPVNAIWEGSGNIMALDVLRAFTRDIEAARSVIATLVAGAADLQGCREAARHIESDLSAVARERQARGLVERLALLAASAALRECAPPMIGDTFARTRLAERHSGLFGTSAIGSSDADTLLRRALPM
jgi:putative acyl-CoA dehydrogenase